MPRGPGRLRTKNGSKNSVGKRVKSQRLKLGITQPVLCGRVANITDGEWNPTPQEIMRIENGKRLVTDLEIIALSNALKCEACWLLTGK